MRRPISAALVTVALLGALGGRVPDLEVRSVSSVGRGPCDEERWMRITPQTWSERKIKGLIRCAVRRWSVPGGAAKAIAVARCESGLWPWAVGGDNLGLYQHKDDYWFGRVDTFLRPEWFNLRQWERLQTRRSGAFIARANVLVSIRMAHRAGWGAWACG